MTVGPRSLIRLPETSLGEDLRHLYCWCNQDRPFCGIDRPCPAALTRAPRCSVCSEMMNSPCPYCGGVVGEPEA